MRRDEPVAIVGVGALFPGSSDVDGFWRDIVLGRDLMRDVPPTHWSLDDYYDPRPDADDRTYGRRGAFLDPVDFDPMEFGIPPAILPATDSAQLLALGVARAVLDDAARGRFTGENRDRISVILGVASATELVAHMAGRLQIPVWERLLREAGLEAGHVDALVKRAGQAYTPWQESTFPGLLGNVVAGRIANRFDLGGTNCVVDAACASSLAAVQMALGELHLGHSDLVITGGVDALNDVLMYMCFSQSTALSSSGDCRPFSDQADGTMLGEGLGMVALKRLAEAERDGDSIYAVIRGIGTSSDGRARSIYAPRAEGQVQALRRCYERAGHGPATVELVEAHGTATAAGDAAEVEALRAVFDADGRADRQWCALGSVKSQIGHTKAAAGIAGLLKAALALHHKVLPATLKVARPNPALALETSPFYLNTATRPWIRGADHPRRASVSSFGFGGTNFHVALEEYSGPGRSAWLSRALPTELFLLSADDPLSLAAACERGAEGAEAARGLSHLARRMQSECDLARQSRLAIVAGDLDELAAALRASASALRAQRPLPAGVAYGSGRSLGDVAFLFPGQGSQYVGMGADVAAAFACARAVWDRAAALDLDVAQGARLHDLVFPPAAFDDGARRAQRERLTATEWAQPAVGAHSLALLSLLRAVGVRPASVGGHSFGELTALAAAGVLDEADFLRTARLRGSLMSSPREPGAMIAVATDAASLRERCPDWPSQVVVANLNGPGQTVLSGPVGAIEEMAARLADAGCAAVRLPVSGAFHSPLMETASAPFRAHLESLRLKPPTCPVYGNVDASRYGPEADAVRRGLAAQLTSPVRFSEQVESMYASGVRIFVEVGPQDVLTRLVGQNLGARPHVAVSLDRHRVSGVTALWQGLGALAAAGVPLDCGPLWEGFRPEPEPRTDGQPRLTVAVSGVNYGKPRLETLPPMEPLAWTPASAVTPPSLPAPAAVPPGGDQWRQAVEAIQRSAADAHETYQRTLAESHNAFLAFAEQSMAALAGAAQVQGTPARPSAAPAMMARPVIAPAGPPNAAAEPPRADTGARVAAAEAAAAASTEPADVAAALLEIVAEQTGYPTDMLRLHMELEGDLGIDSIKRVEILAGLQERWPGLVAIATEEMAAIRTLGDVVDIVKSRLDPSRTSTPSSPPAGATAPPAGLSPAPAPVARVERAVIRLMPAPVSDGLGLPAFRAARRPVVIGGERGLAERITALLAERGRPAEVVEAVPADADAVLALHGLRRVTSVGEAVALDREMLATAREFARAIGDRTGAFIAVQDTGGDFGLAAEADARAWVGGFGGLAKTIARELPAVAVKALDVATEGIAPDALARTIVEEIWSGGPELAVSIRASGERLAAVAVPADRVEDASASIDRDAIVVASGGARGVTAAALVALARRVPARFVLLGRTPLPADDAFTGAVDEAALRRALLAESRGNGDSPSPRSIDARIRQILAGREIRATMGALEAAGAQARYLAVDVRDASAVSAALGEVRRSWGKVTALVHGAGTIADALLRDKTDDAVARVLETKLLGLAALLDATREDPLTHIVLFSSIASWAGNAGQGDYALANAVLDQVAGAEARRRPACRVRSLLWGPWSGGMVTDTVAARLSARGVPLLDLPLGAEAFVRELSSSGDDVAVLLTAATEEATKPAAEAAATIALDPERHPYLASHVINGRPVLPLALVLEWFCRSLGDARATGRSLLCQDVRVLRGVALQDGVWPPLRLRSEPAGDVRRVALVDGEDHRRFQAQVALGSSGAPADGFASDGAPASRWARERLYGTGGVLFHGPAFQVLDDVRGPTPDWAAARVRSTAEMGWPEESWVTDPAAVDGCLQLAVLWAAEVLGRATLPMQIEAYEQYRRPPVSGPLRCALRRRDVGALTASADVRLFGPDDTPIADLRGIALVARPS